MTNKLRVWWIPQVPGKPFYVEVASVEEGVKMMNVLADYDLFQYENNIKPDYANCGGLEEWIEDADGPAKPAWCSWCDDETGEDDPRCYITNKEEKTS